MKFKVQPTGVAGAMLLPQALNSLNLNKIKDAQISPNLKLIRLKNHKPLDIISIEIFIELVIWRKCYARVKLFPSHCKSNIHKGIVTLINKSCKMKWYSVGQQQDNKFGGQEGHGSASS
ncbi:hypothetical protein M8J77_022335 [Diaphorina citri]|nr:hypothetical protein M8J77_022335 [Diaphorina citri]